MTYLKYTNSEVEISAPLALRATTRHLPGCAPTNENTKRRLLVVVLAELPQTVQLAVPEVHPLPCSTSTSYVAAPATGLHTSVVRRGKWSKPKELTCIDVTVLELVAVMRATFAVLGLSFP